MYKLKYLWFSIMVAEIRPFMRTWFWSHYPWSYFSEVLPKQTDLVRQALLIHGKLYSICLAAVSACMEVNRGLCKQDTDTNWHSVSVNLVSLSALSHVVLFTFIKTNKQPFRRMEIWKYYGFCIRILAAHQTK